MKKTTIFLVAMALMVLVLSAFVIVGCTDTTAIAYADEIVDEGGEEVVPELTPIATYTMTDEDGTNWVINILDETNCTLSDGTTETALTYTLVDGILTLTNPVSEVSIAFVVNVDNTLAPYIPEGETEETPKLDMDSITVEAEVDEEKLTEQVTKIIEDFLGNYLQESMVADIVTWLIDIGAMGALVGIFLKYRKYKHTTIGDMEKLVQEVVKKQMEENFKAMDGNTAKFICEAMEAINELSKKFDVVLQATALAQDPSAEGKIAMLKLVQGISDDKKIVEKIEEIKDEIVAEQEAVKEVEEKVAGEYTEIEVF